MGMLYKRRTKNPEDGSVTEGTTWWIKYYRNGRACRESTKTEREMEARKLLRLREGEIAEGKIPGVCLDRVRFEEIADDFLTDYRVNGKKTENRVESIIRIHLEPFFRETRVTDISTARIKKYVAVRQSEGAENATINRELSALKRMFHLAVRSTPPKAGQVPYIPMLKERNVRKGFFEHEEFLTLRAALPEHLRGFVTFAYQTGWRKSEIANLTWDRVSWDGPEKTTGTIRLEAGETKNNDARNYVLNGEVLAVVRKQFRDQRLGSPYVFHREGLRVHEFRKSWGTACKKTGIEGKLFHDLRRTAIRNMIRAGVPERIAMTISGHKTRAVFDRYNIVSDDDLRQASQRVETYLNAKNEG